MIRLFRKKDGEQEKLVKPLSTRDPEDLDLKGSLFKRLQFGLSKTRSSLTGRLDRLVVGKREITADLLEELEEILFTSDIGVVTTEVLIDSVRQKVARKELKDPEALKTALKGQMLEFLKIPPNQDSVPNPGQPLVIMVIGVNGVGKTTTIGKLAHQFRNEGKSVLMVAADTFRAAAVEQLVIWGERVGAEVVRQDTGADPSAVAFDAMTAALSRGTRVVLIDTAGRLHTKKNLMEELQKIQRVVGRKVPGAPHEILLVLDATTGQNAISQAKLFDEALRVRGIILTKLDGTAKGGIIVGISHQLGMPIKFIGIGEKVEDLRPFDAEDFVKALFD
jgi:fused signal recognition particle receptor